MDDAPRFARMAYRLALIAAAIVASFVFAAAHPGNADAKGKKIRACVVKKGPDKGVMHFSRTGKCPKGEKKISWSKKGKRGKQGPAGPAGPAGPQGSGGATDELLATIASQQAAIDGLNAQVKSLSDQLTALTSQFNGVVPKVDALCSQMDTVTDQANALGTVISGLGVGGLAPLTPVITFATPVPAALGAFACSG